MAFCRYYLIYDQNYNKQNGFAKCDVAYFVSMNADVFLRSKDVRNHEISLLYYLSFREKKKSLRTKATKHLYYNGIESISTSTRVNISDHSTRVVHL